MFVLNVIRRRWRSNICVNVKKRRKRNWKKIRVYLLTMKLWMNAFQETGGRRREEKASAKWVFGQKVRKKKKLYLLLIMILDWSDFSVSARNWIRGLELRSVTWKKNFFFMCVISNRNGRCTPCKCVDAALVNFIGAWGFYREKRILVEHVWFFFL